MRKGALVVVAALLIAATLPASAGLQNVEVGGRLRIRGNFVHNVVTAPQPMQLRVPNYFLPFRPVGDMASYVISGGNPDSVQFNGAGILSPVAWDNSNDWKFVEQRTWLNVKADFTDQVCAFIEIDSYDIWGEDFRSNYITGADSRAVTTDDLEVFQAYINVDDFLLEDLSLRVGRQELVFGREWLVGNNDDGPLFRGHSFDGIRLTYGTDVYSVDAWWAKLADTSPAEEDGDIDFYGVYASCKAVDNWVFDLYGLWVRDARRLNDTNFIAPLEWVEDAFDLDDYDATNVYTVGLRAGGLVGPVDINVEGAYQWGDVGQVGYVFKPFLYGDDEAQYEAFAATAEIGYTLADVPWKPRLFVRGDCYSGEDKRDISFADWVNPFDGPDSSVSFNRLFNDQMLSGFFDLNKDLSNSWMGRAGIIVTPKPKLMTGFMVSYFASFDTFDRPTSLDVGSFRIPVAPALSFWTQEGDKDLGWETDIFANYQYSEDLSFWIHWAHLFPGDGLEDGQFVFWNGLVSGQGSDTDESDYITFETQLRF